jgi:uncharacterized repeat protein (TIGR01451 family)
MKNIINNNSIAAFLIGLAVLLVAPVAFAGSAPTVETLGATKVKVDSAQLNLFYTARDASFESGEPISTVTIEYGETSSLGSFTKSRHFTKGSHTVDFTINDLEQEETYYYRAVLYYDGDVIYGDKLRFTTLDPDVNSNLDNDSLDESDSGSGSGSDGDGDVFGFANTGGSSSASGSSSSSGSTSGSSSASGSASTGSVAGASSANDGDSLGTCTDYLCLIIDNDEEEVAQGDIVTYTVYYENISDIELENATLIIDTPEEMRVMSTSSRVREQEGDLTVNLRDLRPGEDDTIKVTGRMSKRSSDDQVIARADVVYGVGSARNTEVATDYDIDEFNGIAGALGASAFGAGFFPATIFGWMLLVAILLAIIWVVRRFYYRPVLATEEYYPEQNSPTGMNAKYTS